MKNIITVCIFTVAVFLFIKLKTTKKMYTEKDFSDALSRLKSEYKPNSETLQLIEKIYRLETAHFTSAQYIKTGSAGMEAAKMGYPYGWTSMTRVWNLPSLKPIGIANFTDNATKKVRPFIVFPSVYAAVVTLYRFLTRNSAGSWNSRDTKAQLTYLSKLNKIKTVYA